MDPVEHVVCRSAADDLRLMRVCRGIFVTEPAVRDDVSARLYSLTDEPVQRLRRAVVSKTRLWHWGMCFILIRRGCPSLDNSTAQTTNIFPTGLRPPLWPILGIMPGPERHLCFIDFDKVFQGVAVRVDHRPPQLLQQEPRRLAAAKARLRLKLQR